MPQHYRYPGAQPFATDQQHIFFGRERDLEALQRLVSLEQMVVVYGKSGLGKSSLLNAGLLPRVETDLSLKPLSVRFNAYTSDNAASPLQKTLLQLGGNSPLLDQITPPGEESLWYQLKSQQLEHRKGYFLVFDQFEELFTYPEEAVKAFAKQLSEALFTTIPDRYRGMLKQKLATTPDLISDADLQQLHTPFPLKVLMAIRSDRMELLNKLKVFLPQILDNMYELLPLNAEQAEAAILSPAYAPGEFATPRFDYEDDAIDKLVDFLSDGGTDSIESFQLQILCSHLEQSVVKAQGRTLITSADLQNPSEILENYYTDKINDIPSEADRRAARHLIEDGLIFEEEERRISLYEGQVQRDFQISPELLRRLLDTHLIRSEPSLRGGYTYELSHDTLVAPVLKAKAIRVAAERKTAEEQARLSRDRELAVERAKRRRATIFAVMGLALAALAIVACIWALDAEKDAKLALKKAVKAQTEAQANLKRFQQEEQQRKELELFQLFEKARIYKEAGYADNALETLEAATKIDTSVETQNRIKELQKEYQQ